MRAAVQRTGSGGKLVEVADVPRPEAVGDRVVVRLRRAALNRMDAMALALPERRESGDVLGSDGAGVVAAVGPDTKVTVRVGDEVIIDPSINWGADAKAPGDDYAIVGAPLGTHAEYIAVPAANVIPKPPHLAWDEAAALPLAGSTAWRALITRGRLASGETIVIGAASSGVGSLGIQIAVHSGARVIAVTSGMDKADQLVGLGAASVVDRSGANFVDDLQRSVGDGAHLALDPTGALWQPFADVLAPGGRLVVVGQIAMPVAEIAVRTVFWKQLDIVGSSMASPMDFAALADHVSRHRWSPKVDSVFPLTEIAAAYDRLDSHERIGKVVLDVT